jgi:hypothetical protein
MLNYNLKGGACRLRACRFLGLSFAVNPQAMFCSVSGSSSNIVGKLFEVLRKENSDLELHVCFLQVGIADDV